MIYAIILLVTILLILAISFGWACLVTWAICFIAGLVGVTLTFSWKLVIAIWIITSVISASKTVHINKN